MIFTNNTAKIRLLVSKYHDDLVYSLEISGLDITADDWDPAIINRNAYKSAGILVSVARRNLRHWDVFLQAIILGCRRESMLMETMDLICETFERIGALPPLGIIQHTLDFDLLKAYCADLSNWLEKYLQNSSNTIGLQPGLMVELLS